MEEDIKILEEFIEAVGEEYEVLREKQALERFIKGYRELEESNSILNESNNFKINKINELEKKIIYLTSLVCINDSDKNYIPKSKVLSIMRDIEKRVEKLFNSTFIPISPRIYNDNKEKYEPMYIGREIAMTTLKALQELMEDK